MTKNIDSCFQKHFELRTGVYEVRRSWKFGTSHYLINPIDYNAFRVPYFQLAGMGPGFTTSSERTLGWYHFQQVAGSSKSDDRSSCQPVVTRSVYSCVACVDSTAQTAQAIWFCRCLAQCSG